MDQLQKFWHTRGILLSGLAELAGKIGLKTKEIQCYQHPSLFMRRPIPVHGFSLRKKLDLETALNVYSHPIPESQRRAVERVAEILDANG